MAVLQMGSAGQCLNGPHIRVHCVARAVEISRASPGYMQPHATPVAVLRGQWGASVLSVILSCSIISGVWSSALLSLFVGDCSCKGPLQRGFSQKFRMMPPFLLQMVICDTKGLGS